MFSFISYMVFLAGIGFTLISILLVYSLVDDIMNKNHEDWVITIIFLFISLWFSFSLISGGILLWNS